MPHHVTVRAIPKFRVFQWLLVAFYQGVIALRKDLLRKVKAHVHFHAYSGNFHIVSLICCGIHGQKLLYDVFHSLEQREGGSYFRYGMSIQTRTILGSALLLKPNLHLKFLKLIPMMNLLVRASATSNSFASSNQITTCVGSLRLTWKSQSISHSLMIQDLILSKLGLWEENFRTAIWANMWVCSLSSALLGNHIAFFPSFR